MPADVASDLDQDLLAEQIRVSQTLAAPRLVGYEVLQLIGTGRYGMVWRAIEEETDAIVAIKRLHQQPVGHSRDETSKLAQLSSARGIVALRKFHLDEEPYCYVMEHLLGGTLADEIRSGAIPYPRAYEVFKLLTSALAYVHKDAIVHCDLKPANVLLDTRGQPRIGDFGQARGLGPGGSSLGTRFYMPPEQADGSVPDPRWDVYALGATFYEMVTGQPPRFDEELNQRLGSSAGSGSEARRNLEAYARHLENAPPLTEHRTVPGMDPAVARLIERCLTPKFEDRPQDATAVEQLIRDCEQAARLKKLERFGGWAPAIMLLVVGVVLLVAGGYILNRLTVEWTNHVNESNGAVADAIAISLQRQFDSRTTVVQQEAKEFAATLQREPAVNDEQVRAQLNGLFEKRRGTDSKRFARWTLTNAVGTMLDNYGLLPDKQKVDSDLGSTGDDFSWRGWFNGDQDGKKSTDDKPNQADLDKFAARNTPFVTPPYKRQGDYQVPVINISCPVKNSQGANIGVLGAQVYFDDFVVEVDKFAQQQGSKRSVLIVNDKRQVIYSRELSDAAKPQKESQGGKPFTIITEPERFNFDEELKSPSVNPYKSAADQEKYLAVSHTIKLADNDQHFAVIVQQDRDFALRPLNSIRWLALGAILALIGVGGVCLWVNVMALRREVAVHA